MIGIFGGTFDPVHYGHLGLARAACEAAELERVIFVPLGVAPHRDQPIASPDLRVQTLAAELESYHGFEIDTTEIEKTSTSWTIETLEHFSRRMPDETLCLLMGSDAFKSIDTWHRWRSLMEYCHIIFVNRAGIEMNLNETVAKFLAENEMKDTKGLFAASTGGVYRIDADIPDISSSAVRERLASGLPVDEYVPEGVLNIIMKNGIYQDEG
jgi:nicotinate-nucleotide adenylyltransferase